MSIKAQIDADLKSAMLAHDEASTVALRGLKAAILNEEVAKGLRETGLPDEEIERVIAREIKKRRESVEIYQQNGRSELAEGELLEIDKIGKYLPEQLSEGEIVEIVDGVLGSMPAGQVSNIGAVMGRVKGEIGTKADMGVVSKIVRERMQS